MFFNVITKNQNKLIFILFFTLFLSSCLIHTQQCIGNAANKSFKCMGSKCTKKCVSQVQCQSKGGILSIPTLICFFADCSTNEIFNVVSQQCDCINGFQRKAPKSPCNKIVQKCNVNGVKQPNGLCQCLSGYTLQNDFCHNCVGVGQTPDFVKKQCVCYQPQFYKAQNGSCVRSNCPGALSYNVKQKKCTCKQGQIMVSNIFCQKKCAQNAYLSNGLCRCVSNELTFVPQKNICMKLLTSCSQSTQSLDRAKNECFCINGYERNPQTKICQRKCETNQYLLNGNCFCLSGYQRKLTTGLCTLIIVSTNPDCTKLQNQLLEISSNQCICKIGFRRNTQGLCVEIIPNCGTNQQYSTTLKVCVCKTSYIKNSITNICQIQQKNPETLSITCPANSKIQNNKCICDLGYSNQGSLCVSICTSNQQFNLKTLSCNCTQGYGLINKICTKCTTNAPTTVNNECFCLNGLKWNNITNLCEINCQINAIQKQITLANNQKVIICVCQSGYDQNTNKQCIKRVDPVCPTVNTVNCPSKSSWDGNRFRCVCINPLQNFINGVCNICQLNQVWSANDDKCICPTGFNIISNTCIKCPINSNFTIDKCSCVSGYYNQNPTNLLNTLCKNCHLSCKSCSGPSQSSCIVCKNPQDSLINGKCIPSNLPCPRGLFKNINSQCQSCGAYCKSCTNNLQCNQCTEGFFIQTLQLGDITTSFCAEKCGDGKRFQYQCDDGNLINGDGCSNSCNIELGWECIDGSSISASVCSKLGSLSKRSKFSLSIPTRFSTQMIQTAKFDYIPGSLQIKNCPQCNNDLLLITMLSYPTYPQIFVEYLSSTKYSFNIRFKFSTLGIFTVPDFSYTVQINPKYNKIFSAEDMAQVQVVNVYSANYAIKDEALNLDLSN